MHFGDYLLSEIKKKGTPVCVGLDTDLTRIPDFIRQKAVAAEKNPWKAAASALLEFNQGIIDAVADLVPAVKIQSAFYEQYGAEGIGVFAETAKYAKSKGLVVIGDVKRGDIDSTALAYARAYLGTSDLFGENLAAFDFDAITVNAYLGYDGIKPFIEQCRKSEKGIFILVKTSNPSSSHFQDVLTNQNNLTNYELMAFFSESWGANDLGTSGYSLVGAVCGATFPLQLKKLRALMPNSIFLVPGYGAQGAKAVDVKEAFGKDGSGAIINSSRGIIYAYEKSEVFGEEGCYEAARVAVLEMAGELEKVRF